MITVIMYRDDRQEFWGCIGRQCQKCSAQQHPEKPEGPKLIFFLSLRSALLQTLKWLRRDAEHSLPFGIQESVELNCHIHLIPSV